MIITTLLSLLILGLLLRFYLQRKGIQEFDAEQFDAVRNDRSTALVLLDVRTAQERASGAIPGSTHIPLQDIRNRAAELKRHGDRLIICYCQTGSRSMSAAVTLKKLGFNVGNLKGGIADWNFLHRNEQKRKGRQ